MRFDEIVYLVAYGNVRWLADLFKCIVKFIQRTSRHSFDCS